MTPFTSTNACSPEHDQLAPRCALEAQVGVVLDRGKCRLGPGDELARRLHGGIGLELRIRSDAGAAILRDPIAAQAFRKRSSVRGLRFARQCQRFFMLTHADQCVGESRHRNAGIRILYCGRLGRAPTPPAVA